MKWWTFSRKHFLLCSWTGPWPQNSFGITRNNTAWQKAETLETGVAISMRELYWRIGTGAADDLTLLTRLPDLTAGLDEGGRVLLRAAWVLPRPSAWPGIWLRQVGSLTKA